MLEALKQLDLAEFMSRCWQTRFEKKGQRLIALSPFREEKTASMYVSRGKDGHWVYFDHGSGSGGTIIDAVMAYEGYNDTGEAIRRATRMAQEVGLLGEVQASYVARPEKQQDLEGLLEKLGNGETTAVRDYLIGRRISQELIAQMISSGMVVLNRHDGSDYCCFVVRDASGKLRSLYNRKMSGSASREKFLLGEQYPFCLDWKKSREADKVYLCEGIIDALSLVTLEKDACVLGLPGAHCSLKINDYLPQKAVLVEAFDRDDAGRAAAKRLQQSHEERTIPFDLKGAGDVNELLCAKLASTGKLSVDDRVAVAMSGKASRELGDAYGVHHSRICKVRAEATGILTEAWGSRQRGRKPKAKPPEEVESSREELAEMTRLYELRGMRIDWLELKVKMAEKRVEEAVGQDKAKKKTPGEVKRMLQLVDQHESKYGHHRRCDRLEQVELTLSGYQRLKKGYVARMTRESAIPPEDVEAVLEFIIKYPEVGAGKVHISLLDLEEAYLSKAGINTVKKVLADATATAYKRRKEAEKAMEAQLREDLEAKRKGKVYLHMRAEYSDHIWAIDFVEIKFQGMKLAVCLVYDEYSQKYLSLNAALTADHELACRCLQAALDGSPEKPKYLRRDNGKPFETVMFQRIMGSIGDYPVPPHSPWYNGSLESCNGSLKTSLKTHGMQEMIKDPSRYREGRKDPEIALGILADLLEGARERLNEGVARKKHGVTPAKAYSGQVRDKLREDVYRAKKVQERRDWIAKTRASRRKGHSLKSLTDKAKAIGKRLIARLDTDALFVLNETLHHRFRMFEA